MTVLTKKEGHLVSSRADEKSRDSSNVHVMPAERGVFDRSHAPAWEPSRTIRRFPSRANIIAGMARLLPTSTAAAVRAGRAREFVSLIVPTLQRGKAVLVDPARVLACFIPRFRRWAKFA